MNTGASISLALAFSAGLLSFLSPCVLPLIPSYVTFITGLGLDDVTRSRRTALIHGLLFVLGFTLIFLALGATATVLGRLLFSQRVWITRAGGLLLVVFGLYMAGVLRIGALDRERRVHLADKPLGFLGTVLVGVAFGAGWTPCLGPVLGGILAYTSSVADLQRGLLLLTAYSLGLGIPFIVSALMVDRFLGWFQRVRRHLGTVNRVAGALLVLVGLLMLTGAFTTMSGWLVDFTPAFLRSRI
ncbi:MAG: cytochrome c biogenesis protein CcdA [Gemmatimonadota bacterium]